MSRKPVDLPAEGGEEPEEHPSWWEHAELSDEEELLVEEDEFESTEAEDPWDDMEELLQPDDAPLPDETEDTRLLGQSGFSTPDDWPADAEDEGES